jgi:hypothetical protein
MPVLMLWIDEAARLFETHKGMDPNERSVRASIDSIVRRVSSTGRFIGIYLINVMQRASKDELPREIKINTLNKASFNQVDKGASMVAIDDESAAIGLPKQVFVYKKGTDKMYYAKTPQSKWNRNLEMLNEKNRLRKDDNNIIKQEYTHWLKVDCSETKTLKPTKIVDDTVKQMSEAITIYKNKLELEQNKNKQLENQMKMLLNSEKKEIIEDEKPFEYTNADSQRDFYADHSYVKKDFSNVKVKIKK